MNQTSVERTLPYVLLLALFGVAIALRPLIPIDETRYMTVAWEMYLTKNFFVPTLNFQPYFQKPPLLFWLVNLAWALFGVSRVAALAVIFVTSSLVVYLTDRLARNLFPGRAEITRCVPWLVVGSVPFVIYSTLILFDLLLTVFVLATTLSLMAFARSGRWRFAAAAGLFIGLGLLAKGPVTYIHVAFPILFYPLWREPAGAPLRKLYHGSALALLLGLIPVLLWLAPAVAATGSDFFYDLVWKQASGRISGNMSGAHARPFYFYLLLVPVMLLPWVFAPELWRPRPLARLRDAFSGRSPDLPILKYLLIWTLGALLIFSAISGKQPHYLIPELAPASIILAYLMVSVPLARIRATALLMLGIFGIGHVIAMATIYTRLDLDPLARFVSERRDADWAFSGSYHGQIDFLARYTKPFAIVDFQDVAAWLQAHPGGYVIEVVGKQPADAEGVVFTLQTVSDFIQVKTRAP